MFVTGVWLSQKMICPQTRSLDSTNPLYFRNSALTDIRNQFLGTPVELINKNRLDILFGNLLQHIYNYYDFYYKTFKNSDDELASFIKKFECICKDTMQVIASYPYFSSNSSDSLNSPVQLFFKYFLEVTHLKKIYESVYCMRVQEYDDENTIEEKGYQIVRANSMATTPGPQEQEDNTLASSETASPSSMVASLFQKGRGVFEHGKEMIGAAVQYTSQKGKDFLEWTRNKYTRDRDIHMLEGFSDALEEIKKSAMPSSRLPIHEWYVLMDEMYRLTRNLQFDGEVPPPSYPPTSQPTNPEKESQSISHFTSPAPGFAAINSTPPPSYLPSPGVSSLPPPNPSSPTAATPPPSYPSSPAGSTPTPSYPYPYPYPSYYPVQTYSGAVNQTPQSSPLGSPADLPFSTSSETTTSDVKKEGQSSSSLTE